MRFFRVCASRLSVRRRARRATLEGRWSVPLVPVDGSRWPRHGPWVRYVGAPCLSAAFLGSSNPIALCVHSAQLGFSP